METDEAPVVSPGEEDKLASDDDDELDLNTESFGQAEENSVTSSADLEINPDGSNEDSQEGLDLSTPNLENPQSPSPQSPSQVPRDFSPQDPEAPQSPYLENPKSPYQENPQSPYQENPQSPYQENPQSPYQENPQSPNQENPQSPYQENPQSPYQENPQSFDQEKPQSLDQENPQSLDQENPQSLDQENPRSLDQEKPQSLDQENPQSLDQENPQSLDQENPQSLDQENPQSLDQENPRSLDQEKPQSLDQENPQSLNLEDPEMPEAQSPPQLDVDTSSQDPENPPSPSQLDSVLKQKYGKNVDLEYEEQSAVDGGNEGQLHEGKKDKMSDNESDSESLSSSLISQRTLENTSENLSDSQRLGTGREEQEVDKVSVGGSSKAEEEGHVVIGLEALESMTTENGRCGSPSIVSETTDTVAGSLVVETGSVGGESGTVRSMPQSEVSDYDYQNVENGEEDFSGANQSDDRLHEDVSDTGEIDSDGDFSDGQDSGKKILEQGEAISSPIDQSGEISQEDDRDQNTPTNADGENEDRPPPDEDFDYDDLDLETATESDSVKGKNNLDSRSDRINSSFLSPESESSQGKDNASQDSIVNRDSKLESDESKDSMSSSAKSVRSPKTNLADDHEVELDYDEEEVIEEKGRHGDTGDDELENGELPDEEEEGEAGEKSEDGELEDEDDCEEGEIREPGNRKPFVKPVCRFYLNGKCTWGNNCRFLHPGVNDKGNYRLIERPDFNNTGMGMRGPFGPGSWGPGEPPREVEFPPPVADPPPTESAWERGLRHAKELMKKASQRKETDPGFEEKRLNLSLEEEREFDKENNGRRVISKDPYVDQSYEDEFYEKPVSAWQQGQYENFEVRWNREPDYSPYRTQDKPRNFRDRRPSPPSPRISPAPIFSNPQHQQPMHTGDRFNKRRDDRREKWREPDEEPFNNSSGPRVRADVWHDPWRRSKSPKRKPRESPSRSRSRGRRRYRRSFSNSSSYSSSSLSGSSRSRSRSSYSSFSSRSSRSSTFSSRSRSRSMDVNRRRPPGGDPNVPPGPAPPGGGPSGGRGGPSGGRGAFMPDAGPGGDRKPLGPANKPGEPRSAVSVKPRHPRPGGLDKRRTVIGPMPRPAVKDKQMSGVEGRGRGMKDREEREMGRGRGMARGRGMEDSGPGRPPGKKRGASLSSSGSSKSRSRSRSSSSTSRSRSVSSVSSGSSSSSSSSSGSADSEHLYRDIAEPDPQEKSTLGAQKTKKKSDPEEGQRIRPDKETKGRRGGKDRPKEKRPRHSSPGGLPPGGRGSGRPRRDPAELPQRPQVTSTTTTTKSKDPMKSVGQKSNIKLTLISKPPDKIGAVSKKRPAESSAGLAPPAKKPPISPTKQPTDKVVKPVARGDKPVQATSPRMKPPQPVPRPPAISQVAKPPPSPLKPVTKPGGLATASAANAAAAAALAAKAAKKSTSSRREELLKQLKAVEDAIARKRSKLP